MSRHRNKIISMIIDAVFPVWLILLVFIPITILLLWKEWKGTHRFRILRTVSAFIMMAAVVFMLLKPKYSTKKSSSIILLTPRYSQNTVDSILQAEPTWTVMHTDNTMPYKNSQLLAYYDLTERGSEIQIILGQGLPHHALDLLDSKSFDFIPAPLPEGITFLSVPDVTYVNRANFIKGTFNASERNVFIKLTGPGGTEDSVLLTNKGRSNFKLSFFPKQTGNLSYTIAINDSTNKKQTENLAIHVEEEQNLKILFIQQYPTFEAQYLKNFLGNKNHSVVLRYQLSKNNFRYEYLNHDPIQINKLTTELLNNFNLIITDEEALETLSPGEKTILKKSIYGGLGLLNLSGNIKTVRSNMFMPFELISVKKDTTVIKVESKSFSLPVSNYRLPLLPSISPVQKNKSGVLSGYTFEGAGKIAFQFLQETYRLALSGDSLAYSEVWTPLIEQVSQPQHQGSQIKICNPFPRYENDPLDIEIISPKQNLSLLDDSIRLSLMEDVSIDDVWHARTWGGKPGWHTLSTEDGASLSYYISRQADWKSLSMVNQLEENTFVNNRSQKNLGEAITTWKEIPPVLFYLIFLIAAGFIWLAPKL